jgi:hypothetical protein
MLIIRLGRSLRSEGASEAEKSHLGGSFGWLLVSGVFLVLRSVDSNFNGDGASANFFALKSGDSFLLLFLTANVDKTVALGAARLTPASANDTGRNNIDTGLSEESRETSVINVETEVGDEEHGLRGFTGGVFTGGTSRLGCLSLAGTRLLFGSGSGSSFAFGGSSSSTLGTFSWLLGLLLALKIDETTSHKTNR